MTTGTAPFPGGSSSSGPETTAGSPSRPLPSSTLQDLLRGQGRAGKSARLDQTRPGFCWRPGTGRTAIFRTWIPSADAWRSAEPFGMAYVPAVFHRFNPFWPNPEPFLSKYRGTLRTSRAGTYQFFTSSQDCSFLLVDGKRSWPLPAGTDPSMTPESRARSSSRRDRTSFDTCMRLPAVTPAWWPPGSRQDRASPNPFHPRRLAPRRSAEYPTIPVKYLARLPRRDRRRGASRRQRPSPGPRPVPHRHAVGGITSQAALGFRRRPDEHTGRAVACLPCSRTLQGGGSGLRRIGITGDRQPRADSPGPGLRRSEPSARPACTVPDDPRQVRPRGA